jgi:hypothetical protein
VHDDGTKLWHVDVASHWGRHVYTLYARMRRAAESTACSMMLEHCRDRLAPGDGMVEAGVRVERSWEVATDAP